MLESRLPDESGCNGYPESLIALDLKLQATLLVVRSVLQELGNFAMAFFLDIRQKPFDNAPYVLNAHAEASQWDRFLGDL